VDVGRRTVNLDVHVLTEQARMFATVPSQEAHALSPAASIEHAIGDRSDDTPP